MKRSPISSPSQYIRKRSKNSQFLKYATTPKNVVKETSDAKLLGYF